LATERARLRAVFDTNVVVAALKTGNPHSPTAELLRRWEADEFDLLYSADIRTEYEEKFAARSIDRLRCEPFLRRLERHGLLVDVPHVTPVIEADPDDDKVVACALTGGANYLVTYDPHFLSLGEEYQGIRIVDGLHFLYVVRGDA
jgi:uncharacterized protein